MRRPTKSQTAREWWLDAIPSGRFASLPRDHDGGVEPRGTARSVSVWPGRVETQALLQRVPAVYGTEINDALLSALGRALARLGVQGLVRRRLEGHGREDLFDGVDLSRTVGWFTTIYPFRLEARQDDPGDALWLPRRSGCERSRTEA